MRLPLTWRKVGMHEQASLHQQPACLRRNGDSRVRPVTSLTAGVDRRLFVTQRLHRPCTRDETTMVTDRGQCDQKSRNGGCELDGWSCYSSDVEPAKLTLRAVTGAVAGNSTVTAITSQWNRRRR